MNNQSCLEFLNDPIGLTMNEKDFVSKVEEQIKNQKTYRWVRLQFTAEDSTDMTWMERLKHGCTMFLRDFNPLPTEFVTAVDPAAQRQVTNCRNRRKKSQKKQNQNIIIISFFYYCYKP